jgi:hypothetical protein
LTETCDPWAVGRRAVVAIEVFLRRASPGLQCSVRNTLRGSVAGRFTSMSRDWIDLLAEHARQQNEAPFGDERYERLISGELAESELPALERSAADSPDSQALLAACRPLDAAEKDRLVEAARSALSKSSASASDLRPGGAPKHEQPSARTDRPSLLRRGVHLRAVVYLIAFVAAGAGSAVVVRTQVRRAIPGYSMTVSPGEASAASRDLELVLAPAESFTEPIAVAVFLRPMTGDQQPTLLDSGAVNVVVSGDGTVRVRVPVRELKKPSGDVEVIVALGRDDEVPRSGFALQTRLLSEEGDAQVFRQSIVLRER